MQLQIESTNVCNASCVFCPYEKHIRPKATMSMDLYRKIIDDAAKIPAINHVTITGLGEPLLDRFLVERIAYARRTMPNGTLLDVFTNGTFLRPSMSEALIEAGIDVIYVSINAVSREKRMEIMKLDDYEQVVEYIRHAQEKCEGTRARVIVKAVIAKDLISGDDTTQFVQMWKGDHDKGGSGFRHLEGNWAGAMWPMRTKITEACGRALNQIMVLADGRVSLCCFDSDGKEILGDLNDQTIKEIFNGPKATGIREAHHDGRRNDVALCSTCTGI